MLLDYYTSEVCIFDAPVQSTPDEGGYPAYFQFSLTHVLTDTLISFYPVTSPSQTRIHLPLRAFQFRTCLAAYVTAVS